MKARRCAWNPSQCRQDFWGRTGHFIGHDGTTNDGRRRRAERVKGRRLLSFEEGNTRGRYGFLAATTMMVAWLMLCRLVSVIGDMNEGQWKDSRRTVEGQWKDSGRTVEGQSKDTRKDTHKDTRKDTRAQGHSQGHSQGQWTECPSSVLRLSLMMM
eukprot:scaffold13663_cov78-Skeletonema_dohrnii-CCMP3373.AAC.5